MAKELRFRGRVWAGALAAMVSMAVAGCGDLATDGETETAVGATTAPPVVASDDILGFEKTPGWTWTSTGQRLSERRTTGIQSFALDAPAYETHLTSQKVSSTATGLANLGDAGSVFALDIMLPELPKTPTATSFVQLKVKSSSRGLAQVDLGKVKLNGLPNGVFTTVKWAIPDSVRSKLAGASYSDLIFDLYIHPYDCPSDTIRIDNLRVKSSLAAPAGAGVSVDLLSQHFYPQDIVTPGEARFGVSIVQIPQSFHVKLGRSTGGTAKLELGYNSTIAWTCTYVAGNVGGTGRSYDFSKCTGGAQVGDLVSVDLVRLSIVKGDASAGTTKIVAQLAGSPLGDTTGRGVIPPIPTFWGDAPAEIDQIIDAYSAALNPANKTRTEERFINLPTPDFALRHGNADARNLLDPSLPPIPNDPPFSQEGHMNPGSGTWDAWWALNGSLSYGDAGDSHTSEFQAELSGHTLIWGFHVPVASMSLDIKTNNGAVTSTGITNPHSEGVMHLVLLGNEIPSPAGVTFGAETGLRKHIEKVLSVDAPTIHVWIFSITAGVQASATFDLVGDLRVNGFFLTATPALSVGAHLEGDIDLGIASGGVRVDVDFLKVSTPIEARLAWAINTSPQVCAATLDFNLKASLAISSLGGSVNLVAKFGVCPFCDHESWNIFNWTGISPPAKEIFNFPLNAASFPIGNVATCRQDLRVKVLNPVDQQHVLSTQKLVLSGTVVRPAGPSQSGAPNPTPGQEPLNIGIDNDIDCQFWTWRSSDPTDTFSPATGCHPTITFGKDGTHAITLSSTDQYGETGLDSVTVNVDLPPPGPIPFITTPVPQLPEAQGFTVNDVIALSGGATHTTGAVTLVWSYIINSTGTETVIGPGETQTMTSPGSAFVLKLTATDASGISHSATLPLSAHGQVK